MEQNAMNKLDCLFIGSATEDILMLVSMPPASDQRIPVEQAAYSCGGVAMVAASAFCKLGGSAGLVTSIGRPSAAGSRVKEVIDGSGFSFRQVIEIPEAETPFSSILVEKSGKRLIAHYGGSMQKVTLDMIDKSALENASLVHLGGVSDGLFLDAARYCKEHTDALVSIDGGNLEREICEQVLPYTDIYIPDDKTVKRTLGLEPKEACEYFCEKGVRVACVTCGEKGCVALSGGKFYEAEAFRVPVLDTTGAGDNFHGAFLYGYTKRWEIGKILRFASAFSGLTCGALGGLAGEPTLKKTLEMSGV